MKIKQFVIAVFCLVSIGLSAQDMQYSYYQFSPISYNPAFTGAFYGNIRVNAMVRDQWRTIVPNNSTIGNEVTSPSSAEFRTLSISLDGNIPFGFKDGDWVSAGLNIVKDREGDTRYQHNFNGLSLAYHLVMGKKQNTVLTIGGKYGTYSKGPMKGEYATGLILAGEFLNMPANDLDIDNLNAGGSLESDQILNETNDLMLGFLLSAPMGDNADIRIGIASDHLLSPTLSVDTTGGGPNNQTRQRLDRRFNANVQYYVDLNDNLTFNPTILYQKMGSASNILLQTLFSYHMPNKDDMALNFGLGFRMANNAVLPFYMGADFNDWRIGASYGINMSGLSGAGREGGFELGITKIFSWNKKAKVKPIFICPRL